MTDLPDKGRRKRGGREPVSNEELGWIADLRQAREAGGDLGPGTADDAPVGDPERHPQPVDGESLREDRPPLGQVGRIAAMSDGPGAVDTRQHHGCADHPGYRHRADPVKGS